MSIEYVDSIPIAFTVPAQTVSTNIATWSPITKRVSGYIRFTTSKEIRGFRIFNTVGALINQSASIQVLNGNVYAASLLGVNESEASVHFTGTINAGSTVYLCF